MTSITMANQGDGRRLVTAPMILGVKSFCAGNQVLDRGQKRGFSRIVGTNQDGQRPKRNLDILQASETLNFNFTQHSEFSLDRPVP